MEGYFEVSTPWDLGVGFHCNTSRRVRFFVFFCKSFITYNTPQQQSAEPRNIAGAEALAVARRPKEASREKKTRPPPLSSGCSP